MKIRKTNGGGWCMEHNGVEAPYVVVAQGNDGTFVIFDLDDGDEEEMPIAVGDADHCEAEALKHFNQ